MISGMIYIMIYLLQMLIMIAVVWANIYFGWTPSGYAAGFLGLAAVYILTVLPLTLVDWFRRKFRRPLGQKRPGKRLKPRRREIGNSPP
jgi:hypothetical protein